MRLVLQIVSWTALAGVILPPLLFLAGSLPLEPDKTGHPALMNVKTLMLIFTVVWFTATPFWMERGK